MTLVRSTFLALVLAMSSGSAVLAQEMPLGDYLASIDRAEITFSGQIQYNDRQDSFTFYDEDLGLFSVTVDAGREVRERIEEECRRGSMFSRTNACRVTGSGTIEIRGADIALSISTVDELLNSNPDILDEDISGLVGDILGGPPAGNEAPPMTGAERDAFLKSVNRCWNIDPGSVAARVTVEVGFNLDRDGYVKNNDIRLLSSQGDEGAAAVAFQAARRAILRCQSGGYQLPADKYDQWQDIVVTFDPSGVRLR